MTPTLRSTFIQMSIEAGVVEHVVHLCCDTSDEDLVAAGCSFLADFTFFSDQGTQAVMNCFDSIFVLCQKVFACTSWEESIPVLEGAMILLVNLAATTPSCHPLLLPLVLDVCVPIIEHPKSTDYARGNMILLLANLSMTQQQELRDMRVADPLLRLVLQDNVSGLRRSVAESVIIFLHGHEKCSEVDRLMEVNVVGDYCVPILEQSLERKEFRGMFPFLIYSTRLFHILAMCSEYALALVEDPRAVPLLIRASLHEDVAVRVDCDTEGRRFALQALTCLVSQRAWPWASGRLDPPVSEFLGRGLPGLLVDNHPVVRTAAAGLWVVLHPMVKRVLNALGQQVVAEGKCLGCIWHGRVLPFVFPSLAEVPPL